MKKLNKNIVFMIMGILCSLIVMVGLLWWQAHYSLSITTNGNVFPSTITCPAFLENMPPWVLILYIIFGIVYFDLYTTGRDKGYTSKKTTAPILCGTLFCMFFISYFRGHSSWDVSPLAWLCGCVLAWYFITRLCIPDPDGVLDANAVNSVGLLAAATCAGLAIDDLCTWALLIVYCALTLTVFLSDVIPAIIKIIRK